MIKAETFSERLHSLICSSETVPPEEFVRLADAAETEAEATLDPELFHLAPVAWYENPVESSKRSQKVRQLTEKTLSLDPAHQFARQYQAYMCFDEQRYAEAEEHLEKLDNSFFESLEQHWRLLKNQELLLVARIERSRDCDDAAFIKLLSEYEECSDLGGATRTPRAGHVLIPKLNCFSCWRRAKESLLVSGRTARFRDSSAGLLTCQMSHELIVLTVFS